MPHAPGHGRYGFGTGMPEDIFGAFSNVAPFVPPEYNEEQFRMAMGFVPVAGTAYNWNEMGPWERALSVGLDVADVATLGGGKAVTFPIKTVSKAIQKFMMRNDPSLVYLRAGWLPPANLDPLDRVADFKPDPHILAEYAAGRGKQYDLPGRSAIWTTDPPGMERGISTYQALEYPGGRGFPGQLGVPTDEVQYIMRDQPDVDIGLGEWTTLGGRLPKAMERTTNPWDTQKAVMEAVATRDTPMYKFSDMDIMNVLGKDREALIDAAKGVGRGEEVDPGNIWRQADWHPGHQRTYIDPQFAKYDQFGNVIPYDIARWANRANLPSTIPYTVPARGFDWSEGDFAWNAPGLFGGAETEPSIQRAEGEGKILSLGALP